MSPLPTVIKDYMIENKFSAKPGTTARRDKHNPKVFIYKVTDSHTQQNLEVKIKLNLIKDPT